MRIVIPGGSGQIGTMLARSFRAAGHEVVVLGRQPFVAPWRVVFRDARTAGLWERELEIGTRLLGTESELVLKSRRVIPSRLLASGFVFAYPEWSGAVAELTARGSRSLP